jgi:hypothetical protein
MTKPVASFRSVVIEDSRHAVRLDENSHLVLFPSFSRYITSWTISATWPVEASRSRATGRDRVYGWLSVVYHVSEVRLEAGSGWSLRPPTTIYRLYLEAQFSRTTGGVDFCPLDRAVGVNPGLSPENGCARLEVLCSQHQTAICNGYM